MDGTELLGQKISVRQTRARTGGERTFGRGGGVGGGYPPNFRPPTTGWKLSIENVPDVFSWQDLKDLARTAGESVKYADVFTDQHDGKKKGFDTHIHIQRGG